MTFDEWYNQYGEPEDNGDWWKDYRQELSAVWDNLERHNLPNDTIIETFDTIYTAVSNQYQ